MYVKFDGKIKIVEDLNKHTISLIDISDNLLSLLGMQKPDDFISVFEANIFSNHVLGMFREYEGHDGDYFTLTSFLQRVTNFSLVDRGGNILRFRKRARYSYNVNLNYEATDIFLQEVHVADLWKVYLDRINLSAGFFLSCGYRDMPTIANYVSVLNNFSLRFGVCTLILCVRYSVDEQSNIPSWNAQQDSCGLGISVGGSCAFVQPVSDRVYFVGLFCPNKNEIISVVKGIYHDAILACGEQVDKKSISIGCGEISSHYCSSEALEDLMCFAGRVSDAGGGFAVMEGDIDMNVER